MDTDTGESSKALGFRDDGGPTGSQGQFELRNLFPSVFICVHLWSKTETCAYEA